MEFNENEDLENRSDFPKHDLGEPPGQQGASDYDKAKPSRTNISGEPPKPEKAERGKGENDRAKKSDADQNDDDNALNIPGPNELPDQQKVGENVDEGDKTHVET